MLTWILMILDLFSLTSITLIQFKMNVSLSFVIFPSLYLIGKGFVFRDFMSIIDLLVRNLQKRLSDRKLGVELTEAAKSWLAKKGFDPLFGARPLRRAIERYVENPLSTKLLRGEFSPGDTIIVGCGDDGLTFTTRAAAVAVQ